MKEITRSWDGMPTAVEDRIQEGDILNNTLISGFGGVVVDKDFLNEMYTIADEIGVEKDAVKLFSIIHNKISNYFFSRLSGDVSRATYYDENYIKDEDGQIIGTPASSLKEKNVAKCSEKSLAAYIILERMFKEGSIGRKPILFLSHLGIDDSQMEPHAFIILNKEDDNEITRHILFDIENPTFIETPDGKRVYWVGIYSLTDNQYNDFLSGEKCSPKSLWELDPEISVIEEKRIYGRSLSNVSVLK